MKKKFLLIYFIIIGIVLIYIVFLAPSKLFMDNKVNKSSNSFSKVLNNFKVIIKDDYSYEYDILLLDKEYHCKGMVVSGSDSGQCDKPDKISYDSRNKKDIFKNAKYIDLTELIKLLSNKKYYLERYGEVTRTVYEIDDKKVSLYESDVNEIKVFIEDKEGTYIIKLLK